jgi:WD40 repeat protein
VSVATGFSVPALSIRQEIILMAHIVRRLTLIAILILLLVRPVKGDSFQVENQTGEKEAPARTDLLGDPLPQGALARLGSRRFCGPRDPEWAGFSQDGTKVASLNWNALSVWDAASGLPLLERNDYHVSPHAVGWRADGTGIAVVRLRDGSYFLSAFTNPAEKVPTRPPIGGPNPALNPGPDGMDLLALSPQATRLAVIRNGNEERFKIDLLQATPNRLVTDLKLERTLGPFPGPCREVRYTAGGRLVFLSGPWKEKANWTIAVVDEEKNVISQTSRIPPPAFCVWRHMLSLSADAQLAAIPVRTRISTNTHVGTIRVWDLAADKELWSFPFPDSGYGTGHAFALDGKLLIMATDQTLFQLRDLKTGKEVARSPVSSTAQYGGKASAVAVSPDGKRFATAGRDGRVEIWDIATGKAATPLATHRDVIDAVAVSPDGRLAATLGYDDSARVWGLATGKPVSVIPAPLDKAPKGRFWSKRSLTFIPDGRGLLFPAAGKLALADPATGKGRDLPAGMGGHRGNIGGFTADGKTLATYADDTITLWDWPEGTARVVVRAPLKPDSQRPVIPGLPQKQSPSESGINNDDEKVVTINSVALSPDGRFLFTNSINWRTGSQNGNDIWDTRTGKHLHRLTVPATEYPPAVFAPNSQVMYLGGHSFDGARGERRMTDALTAWNPAEATLLRRFAIGKALRRPLLGMEFHRTVQTIAVSPDSRLLAAAEGDFSIDHSVFVYETLTGRVIKKFAGHVRPVTCLVFSSDGRRLVSVSEDQTGLVWDVTLSALAGVRNGRPVDSELAEAWDHLEDPDPGRGYACMATLASAPERAVPLLRAKLRPASVPTDADLDRVVGQLSAEAFADREKASAELESFGLNAVAGIKVRVPRVKSPEVRQRLNRFLGLYDGPDLSPYQVRCTRGVAVLEVISTPDAAALLAKLAKGPTNEPLTQEARACLGRMAKKDQ